MKKLGCVSGQPPASQYEGQSGATTHGKCSQLD